MTSSEGPKSPVSPRSQKKSTALAAALAGIDVALAVLANYFFDSLAATIAVSLLGVLLVGLTVINVRAENGERILLWSRIRRIVAGRIFVAIAAAILTAALTLTIVHFVENAHGGTPTDPASADTTTAPASCDLKTGGAGVVEVQAQAGAPSGLTFCPALLNNGAPITGPFNVAGQFVGSKDLYSDLVIVNQADPDTCDVYGNKPDTGYYYARTMTIAADGHWSFRDSLGYDEAVTIARNYEIVSGPPASISAIKNNRSDFAKAHGGSDDTYTGMESLPADARIVATFRQAPGKYKGKGSPCKNT
jgi:hypothetical protein